jgi:hypothetical protein
MSNEQKSQDQQQGQQGQQGQEAQQQDQQAVQPGSQQHSSPDFDGLQHKKPEELTPEELRLMADTMPGEGPGD